MCNEVIAIAGDARSHIVEQVRPFVGEGAAWDKAVAAASKK